MKVVKIYSDNQTLELYNSFLGKETVKLNGEVVSSKYSAFGTTHSCSITSNDEKILYKIRFRPGLPASFDIYRNGEPLIESPRHGFWRSVFFGFFFIFVFELTQGRIPLPF